MSEKTSDRGKRNHKFRALNTCQYPLINYLTSPAENSSLNDENDDGTMDVVAYDYNQDGEWDKFEELS